MNIFIIYAHPSNDSFTFQVFENLLNGISDAGHDIEISDLYKMGFKAEISPEEYEREGHAKINLPLPDDILEEQAKIEKADCIIFLFPIWWSDCPAILKGWIDRVFSVGYAYGYDDQGEKVRKMKKIPSGLVITTAGHPNDFLEKTDIAESMRKIWLNDRLGPRFEKSEMIILGGTLEIEQVREKHLNEAYNIGKNINNEVR